MPDSIATHAFCVRVRFKLCKTQAVAEPSGSVARGASRPSARGAPPSPVSQAVQRGGAALRAVRAHRDDESKIKEEGMDPAP